MKLSFLFIFVTTMHVSASLFSQSATLDISVKEMPVKNVLKLLESKSTYRFFYSDDFKALDQTISLKLEDSSFDLILSKILESTSATYHVLENNIVVISPYSLQQQTITGTITDISNGEPIIGANVVIEGTTVGTVTDLNGNFKIDVPNSEAVLVITYIGYNTEKIIVGNLKQLDVKLVPDITKLDEVIVVGYGTKLKGELTGSVAKINSEAISSRPVTGTLNALQGIVPGVTITRNSGRPGRENYELNIRGFSSKNGNKPLILIDGIPGELSLINPADIENITVLKDAAAAIYGARAADGVMIITTKKGKKSDKVKVDYTGNFGVKKPSFLKKMANTYDLAASFNDGRINDGDPLKFDDSDFVKIKANDPGVGPGKMLYLESYPMWYQSHDHYGELFENAFYQSHNLSLSGGSDKVTYLISGGYMNDNGNIKFGDNKSDRYNIRSNTQYSITNKLKADVRVGFDYMDIAEPSQIDDALGIALTNWSYVPLKTPKGNYYSYQGYSNSMQRLEEAGKRSTQFYKVSTNLKLDYEIISGLTLTGQAGFNFDKYEDNSYYRTITEYNWDESVNGKRNDPNSAYYLDNTTKYSNLTAYANYTKTMGNHNLGIMAGASKEGSDFKQKYFGAQRFSSNEIFPLSLADPTLLNTGSNRWSFTDWALISYFGRFNYSFGGRYYLDATFRKDGSSKFEESKRWSTVYPSISAAWNLSNESFFSNSISKSIVDNLKFRASWGRTGNQDISALGNYDYVQLISITGSYPMDNSNPSKTASMRGMASKERTWETIENYNVGIDLGLLKSKLNATFDIYKKVNNNMLVSVVYPSILGAEAPTTNAGKLDIKGWDASLNWKDNIGDFQYNLGVIINYNENELTDLQGQDNFNTGLTSFREGYPIYSYFGFKSAGIIKTKDQLKEYGDKFAGKGIVPAMNSSLDGYKTLGVGDLMYQDINGDGKITVYGDDGKEGDAVFLGSRLPKYTYTIQGGASYKGFDLGFIMQGTGEKYTYRGGWESDNNWANFGAPYTWPWFQPFQYFMGKTFTEGETTYYPANLDAQYPRITHADNIKANNYRCSDVWVENTSYLRLKNITLGYTLPKVVLEKLKIEGMRVYVSGQDLFEFAKGTWDGNFDPEESGVGSTNEKQYAFYRTFSFGVDIKF